MSIRDFRHEFQRHKDLADRAMSELSDEMFFHSPGDNVNSIALIVKHVGGNLRSLIRRTTSDKSCTSPAHCARLANG